MFICTSCKKECDTVTVCEMCGEEPHGIDIDTGFCRFCKDHSEFIELSDCCGANVAFSAPDNTEVDEQTVSKIDLKDIIKLYPNMTSEEADAIAFTYLDDLKKQGNVEKMKQFLKMIEDELARRDKLKNDTH